MPADFPLNDRQRRFAEFVVAGVSASEAYRRAGYRAKGHSAEVEASKALRKPEVAEYVALLRARSSQDCRWTLKQAMDWLCDIMETPIGQVGPDHPLAQEYATSTGATSSSERIKMPAKLDAFEKLARICGWYQPEKVSLEVATQETVQRRIAESPGYRASLEHALKLADRRQTEPSEPGPN